MDVPLGIFRIAGIYGPGRNALVNLADGKARRLVKPGQVFNRIHVADIADDPWPPRRQVRRRGSTTSPTTSRRRRRTSSPIAADLMGVAPPPEIPFDEAQLSPMARSFYGENKRVSNARIRQELGVDLRYPTYREGLAAMWREGRGLEKPSATPDVKERRR